MTIKELINYIPVKLVTKDLDLDRNISGVYCGDLLSYAMSKSKEDNIWITVQSHMNVIAVATLVGLAAVIIVEGSDIDEDVIEKAKEEGIIILTTKASAYEIAKNCVAKGL